MRELHPPNLGTVQALVEPCPRCHQAAEHMDFQPIKGDPIEGSYTTATHVAFCAQTAHPVLATVTIKLLEVPLPKAEPGPA